MDQQPEKSPVQSPEPGSRRQAWLAPVVVAMMAAQLGLLWIQGGLLHRQHQEIRDLREDIQFLSESLDTAASPDLGEESQGISPSRNLRSHRRGRFQPVRYLQEASEPKPSSEAKPDGSSPEDSSARKDLDAAKASAQKAVADAREVQSKLSIEENIRRSDEKAKLDQAEHTWQKWFWAAVGLGVVAMVVRAWLRRRG